MGLVLSTARGILCAIYLTKITQNHCNDKTFESCDNVCCSTCNSEQTVQEINDSNCRSRREKFLAINTNTNSGRKEEYSAVRSRYRKPSRIPKNALTRVLKKSRKLRRLVRKFVFKNFAQSSSMHNYTKMVSFQCMSMYCYNMYYKPVKQFSRKLRKNKYKAKHLESNYQQWHIDTSSLPDYQTFANNV